MKLNARQVETAKTKPTKWTMARGALGESGLWSDDAIERQLSHSERNNVRAAYIHTSEHLDERRLMVQWWADYLDANKNEFVTSFDYAKLKAY